jgi:hypothetical protein
LSECAFEIGRVRRIADGIDQLQSMVGPALPGVTSSEGLTQDEHHGEEPRWHGGQTRGTPQYHARQLHSKYYPQGGDPGKRNVQRSSKGADHRVGGAPDMTGRIKLPSSPCSSNHSSQSNLDRFLDETTPRVRTHTFPKVFVFLSGGTIVSRSECTNCRFLLFVCTWSW